MLQEMRALLLTSLLNAAGDAALAFSWHFSSISDGFLEPPRGSCH